MNRAERRAAAKESRQMDTLNRHGFDIIRHSFRGKNAGLIFASYFTTKHRKRR